MSIMSSSGSESNWSELSRPIGMTLQCGMLLMMGRGVDAFVTGRESFSDGVYMRLLRVMKSGGRGSDGG